VSFLIVEILLLQMSFILNLPLKTLVIEFKTQIIIKFNF
jgi:hypothetical protein